MELVRDDTLPAVGRLARGTAGVLDLQLGIITSAAKLALAALPADAVIREEIGEIQAAADRVEELVVQMSEVAEHAGRHADADHDGAGSRTLEAGAAQAALGRLLVTLGGIATGECVQTEASCTPLDSPRLELLARIAARTAHQVNNVLTAIKGNGELALMELAPNHPAHGHLEEICRAAESIEELAMRLLAFAGRQPLCPDRLSVESVISELRGTLREVAGADVEVRTDLAVSGAVVEADRVRLEQVITELVRNARSAMPDGGTVNIGVAVVNPGEIDHTLDGSSPSNEEHVRITVRDTGRGMDEVTRRQMFDPFFSTSSSAGSGTVGLGLSMVHGIVSQSEGVVTCRSEPGAGTTLEVYLPVAGRITPPVAGGGSDLPRQRGATVLLIEDDTGVRDWLRKLLVRWDYMVLEASDGAGALHVARTHPGPIHLLISDVVMPVMSGPDAVRQILELRPSVRIVFMSGFPHGTLLSHRLRGKPVELMLKPVTPVILSRTLAAVWKLDETAVRGQA